MKGKVMLKTGEALLRSHPETDNVHVRKGSLDENRCIAVAEERLDGRRKGCDGARCSTTLV